QRRWPRWPRRRSSWCRPGTGRCRSSYSSSRRSCTRSVLLHRESAQRVQTLRLFGVDLVRYRGPETTDGLLALAAQSLPLLHRQDERIGQRLDGELVGLRLTLLLGVDDAGRDERGLDTTRGSEGEPGDGEAG